VKSFESLNVRFALQGSGFRIYSSGLGVLRIQQGSGLRINFGKGV
jgi:putative component of toxin-antitoxin plasmid stabilization module